MKRLSCAVGALLIFTFYLLLAAAGAAGRAADSLPEPTPLEVPPAPTFSLSTTTTTTATPTTTTTTTTRPTTRKTTTTTRAAKRKNGMTYLGYYWITGYDSCVDCCGKDDGITASGAHVTADRTVAMMGVPFGTRIYIDGLGEYVVEDRGVGSGVIDVYCPTHAECYAITGHYDVYIVD